MCTYIIYEGHMPQCTHDCAGCVWNEKTKEEDEEEYCPRHCTYECEKCICECGGHR